jgi:hypothetical protein
MFTFINSDSLNIEFDPIQIVERHYPSVAFNITAIWTMPYQQAKIEIKEYWIANSELNQFEQDFQDFIKNRNDFVKLCNMGLEPILKFSRTDEKIIFELIAQDTAKIGTLMIKTELYSQELLAILENIKSWAKWW